MTQLNQFLLWQLREFASIFKDLTIGKVTVLLLGAQFGHLVYHLLSTGSLPQDCVMLYTIPLTMVLAAIAEMFKIQWDRFKREQERVVKNLTD